MLNYLSVGVHYYCCHLCVCVCVCVCVWNVCAEWDVDLWTAVSEWAAGGNFWWKDQSGTFLLLYAQLHEYWVN